MQGFRRKSRLRTLTAALGAVAVPVLLPASASAFALTPESPASPAAESTQTAYIVMGIISLLLALALIGGLLAALRGSREGSPRRIRGTSGVQRRVGLGLGALAAIVFVFGIIVSQSASEVESTGPDGLLTAQTDLSIPADAKPLQIRVSGQQWLWRYEYPDGTFTYYDMVVPVDTAVVLNIESTDVLHRWSVPALGGSADAVPGSANQTWFKATETGTYEGRSLQFSGSGYPAMRAEVTVVEPDEYEAWLAEQRQNIKDAQRKVADAVAAGIAPGSAAAGESAVAAPEGGE